MTTIAAYVTDTQAAIAADRCIHLDGTNTEARESKIIRCGSWAIAAAGVAGLHRRALATAEDFTDVDALADHLLAWWKENGKLDQHGAMQGTVALAVQGCRAWTIDTDGVTHEVDRYAAIGSGADYALGALHCGWRSEGDLGIKGVAALAVGAAVVHDPYTDGEIDVVVLP